MVKGKATSVWLGGALLSALAASAWGAGSVPKPGGGLVAEIQKRLEGDGARPILNWNITYYALWPYVHNLVPHRVQYNFARFQDVWIDK